MVAAIPDLELSVLDGIAGDTVYLADLQAGLEGIEEGDGRGFTGFQRNFLRDGAENDMVGNIDLRYFECANRNRVEENPPMVIGGGAGRKAAVDLLDAVGHALDRLSVGDVFLDDLKTRLFIVHKGDLAGLAGAQRHGLLGIGYDVRLGNGFLTHNIDTGRNGRERCGAVRPGRDGSGIAAGNGLNGKHRAGNRFAAHGIPLGDLHIGQCVIFGSDRVLLVTIGGIDIDADGRRVGAVALRGLGFHEGPQALGDILDLNDSAILGHIAADDLTVAVNIKFCAIQTTGRSCGNLPQRNISVPSWRLSRLRCIGDEFSRRIIVKESLTPLNAGFRVDRPFCSFIFYHSGDDALFCVFFNLALKFCVFLGLFFQHPIDIAQIHFIGIGVGVTTAIDVTIALTLEGLVIPHIRLRSHKKAAGDVTLIVRNERHHPFEVFKLLGIQFTHAALRQRCFQDSVRVRAGGGCIGVRVEERRSTPAVAIAAIHAVEHFPRCHGRLIAVRRSVMEQAGRTVICVAGGLDAGTGAGRRQCRGRQQTQNGHQYKQQ